jgi:Skp family chaperone for outer membrane proteins
MRFMVLSAAAIAAVAFAATPDAHAQRGRNNNQSTTVIVVNYQRVLAETALGRDISTKLQQIRTQLATEAQALAPEQQSLEQERQRLATGTRNMTAEQIRASTTWAPQFQQFQTRLQQFQARTQGLQGDMECTQAMTLRDFDRQISPIVRSAMESRGAGVALDSSQVQMTLPAFDVTTTIIQQLDQNPATRTATVARHPVSECQAQAPAAPAQ